MVKAVAPMAGKIRNEKNIRERESKRAYLSVKKERGSNRGKGTRRLAYVKGA